MGRQPGRAGAHEAAPSATHKKRRTNDRLADPVRPFLLQLSAGSALLARRSRWSVLRTGKRANLPIVAILRLRSVGGISDREIASIGRCRQFPLRTSSTSLIEPM